MKYVHDYHNAIKSPSTYIHIDARMYTHTHTHIHTHRHTNIRMYNIHTHVHTIHKDTTHIHTQISK